MNVFKIIHDLIYGSSKELDQPTEPIPSKEDVKKYSYSLHPVEKGSTQSPFSIKNNFIVIDHKHPHKIKYTKKDKSARSYFELTKYLINDSVKPPEIPKKHKQSINNEVKFNKVKINERESRDSNNHAIGSRNSQIIKKKDKVNTQEKTSSQTNILNNFKGNFEIEHNNQLNIHQERELLFKCPIPKELEHVRPDKERIKLISQMTIDKNVEITIENNEGKPVSNSGIKNPFIAYKNYKIEENFNITISSQKIENNDKNSNTKETECKKLSESVLKKNNFTEDLPKSEFNLTQKNQEHKDVESPQSFNPNSTIRINNLLEKQGKEEFKINPTINVNVHNPKTDVNANNPKKTEVDIKRLEEKFVKEQTSSKDHLDSNSKINNLENDNLSSKEQKIQNSTDYDEINRNLSILRKESKLETSSSEKSRIIYDESSKPEIPKRVIQSIDVSETKTSESNKNSSTNFHENHQEGSLLNNQLNPFAPNFINRNISKTTSIFNSSNLIDNPFTHLTSPSIASSNIQNNNPLFQGSYQSFAINFNNNNTSNYTNHVNLHATVSNNIVNPIHNNEADMDCEISTIGNSNKFPVLNSMNNTPPINTFNNPNNNHFLNPQFNSNNPFTIGNQSQSISNPNIYNIPSNTIPVNDRIINTNSNNILSNPFAPKNNEQLNYLQSNVLHTQPAQTLNFTQNNPFTKNLWNISNNTNQNNPSTSHSNPFFQTQKNVNVKKSYFE